MWNIILKCKKKIGSNIDKEFLVINKIITFIKLNQVFDYKNINKKIYGFFTYNSTYLPTAYFTANMRNALKQIV